MTAVPRRKPVKKKFDMARFVQTFTDWNSERQREKDAKAEHERLRDELLMPALIEAGAAHGEKGQHLAIELPEQVGEYVRVVRRANTSTYLNIDAAEKLLKKKDVLPECQVVSVSITGIPATQLLELEAALAKLQLEKKFQVLPDIQTSFSQERMYALHQRHRQELEEREARGERITATERKKYLTAEELDGLIESTTNYSFFPEKK